MFRGVDKAHVIQEARAFNDPNVESSRSVSHKLPRYPPAAGGPGWARPHSSPLVPHAACITWG